MGRAPQLDTIPEGVDTYLAGMLGMSSKSGKLHFANYMPKKGGFSFQLYAVESVSIAFPGWVG